MILVNNFLKRHNESLCTLPYLPRYTRNLLSLGQDHKLNSNFYMLRSYRVKCICRVWRLLTLRLGCLVLVRCYGIRDLYCTPYPGLAVIKYRDKGKIVAPELAWDRPQICLVWSIVPLSSPRFAQSSATDCSSHAVPGQIQLCPCKSMQQTFHHLKKTNGDGRKTKTVSHLVQEKAVTSGSSMARKRYLQTINLCSRGL